MRGVRSLLVLVSALGLFVLKTQAGPQQPPLRQPNGVSARATANDYTAKIEVGDTTYAASLVPAAEVKHIFAFDITKTYIVLEVAVYPGGAHMQLNPDAFVVHIPDALDVAHRADSMTVASVIQQRSLPQPPFEEHAQNGRGVKRATRRTGEFLC